VGSRAHAGSMRDLSPGVGATAHRVPLPGSTIRRTRSRVLWPRGTVRYAHGQQARRGLTARTGPRGSSACGSAHH
jgi:hypothetical protein